LKYELLNILLVDDNRHMRAMLTAILRAVGVSNIFDANDGAEALQVLRRQDIDLVMTDLQMEPVDGIDFVRLLRNSPDSPCPMVPVIMITGHSTMRRVAEARDVGVTEFLSKPITARGVLQRIGLVVNQPRAFIRTEDYFGPDRRRRRDPAYQGPRRRADDRRAMSI